MAQPQHTNSDVTAAHDAAAGDSTQPAEALPAGDSVYSQRPPRSRLGRPYRKLKRRIRHTPTRELVGSAIVLAIAVIGLVVVFAITLK